MIANEYLSGSKLYGDDLPLDMIQEWYADESEGYASLSDSDPADPAYVYHQLNKLHGFSRLTDRHFPRALGFGSAYGEEFKPIIDRIDEITILDPSDKFVRPSIHSKPARYIKPNISGQMPFPNEQFDLCLCLGALHHVPNVTFVVSEIFRCLAVGGMALIREPIVSMGDWSRPRRGLTRHERGIPLPLFRNLILQAGFEIQSERPCVFPLLPKLSNRLGVAAFDNRILTQINAILCKITAGNIAYHRQGVLSKLGPSSVYYVLAKTSA